MKQYNKDNNMKNHKKGKHIVKKIVFSIIALAVMSLATMLLWNWLMPTIFGLTLISIWQAAGLLLLSHILFGAKRYHRRPAAQDKEHYHKQLFKQRFFASKGEVNKKVE